MAGEKQGFLASLPYHLRLGWSTAAHISHAGSSREAMSLAKETEEDKKENVRHLLHIAAGSVRSQPQETVRDMQVSADPKSREDK